jgi:hypothetical protein
MSDLKDRLQDLDALGEPDVWGRVGSAHPHTEVALRDRHPGRWAAAFLALALAAGAIAFAARAFHATTPAATKSWARYEDPGALWHLRHPVSWQVQPFGEGTFSNGVLISNVRFRFRHAHPPGYNTSAWDMRGLPTAAVVLQVGFQEAGATAPHPPWSRFPLRLSEARLVRDHPAFGAPQPRLFLPVQVPHQPHSYFVFAWFGPDASDADQEAASRIVASLRFLVPRAVLIPDHGAVGSTVTMRGTGFRGDWRAFANGRDFRLTLLAQPATPSGCDTTIGAQFEVPTQAHVHVDAAGHLSGSFRVPRVGHCSADRPGDPAHRPVRAGVYTALIGCYQCDLAEFQVTQPTASAVVEPCRAEDVAIRPFWAHATQMVGGWWQLTNRGSDTCLLEEPFRVRLIDENGQRVNVRQIKPSPGLNLAPIELASGATARGLFAWSNWCGESSGASSLTLALPHGGGTVGAKAPRTVPLCSNKKGRSVLSFQCCEIQGVRSSGASATSDASSVYTQLRGEIVALLD